MYNYGKENVHKPSQMGAKAAKAKLNASRHVHMEMALANNQNRTRLIHRDVYPANKFNDGKNPN